MPIIEIIHEIDAYLSRLRQARELLSGRLTEAPQTELPSRGKKAPVKRAPPAMSTTRQAGGNKSRSNRPVAHPKGKKRLGGPAAGVSSALIPMPEPFGATSHRATGKHNTAECHDNPAFRQSANQVIQIRRSSHRQLGHAHKIGTHPTRHRPCWPHECQNRGGFRRSGSAGTGAGCTACDSEAAHSRLWAERQAGFRGFVRGRYRSLKRFTSVAIC